MNRISTTHYGTRETRRRDRAEMVLSVAGMLAAAVGYYLLWLVIL
jgi:hypothetical protein